MRHFRLLIVAAIIVVCSVSILISLTWNYDGRHSGNSLVVWKSYFTSPGHQASGQAVQLEEEPGTLDLNLTSESLKVLKGVLDLQEKLDNQPTLACLVLTQDKNLATKAKAVRDTWGKRCDKTIYFSSSPANASFPTIALNVSEGRQHLTEKTFQAFSHCFREFGQRFDWFLKADDDTYIIVDNLKAFLTGFDPQSPLYFGYRFKPYTAQGFMSGGAGYVLSQEALRVFVGQGVLGHQCRPSTVRQVEDVEVGQCLHRLGVKAMDSIDDLGRQRFHPLNLLSYMYRKYMPAWLHNHTLQPVRMGKDCCSDQTISFHYLRPPEMYVYDFLLYRIRVSNTHLDDSY